MGLLIVCLVILVAFSLGLATYGFVIFNTSRNARISNCAIGSLLGLGIGLGICVIFALCVGLPVMMSSIGNINNMVSYYDANAEAYEEAVSALYAGVPTEDIGLLDAANLEQIKAYKQVIIDQRQAVISYNNNYVSTEYWQDNFWAGWLIRDLPERLQLIKVGE